MRGRKYYRSLTNPGFNKNLGTYYGKGIYKGGKKRMRMWRKGRQVTKGIFRDRYKKEKFSKWLSKYK